jgi:hypothetical protein
VTIQPITCFGGESQVYASIIGGVGPYTFTWSSYNGSLPQILAQPAPEPIFIDLVFPNFFVSSNTNITCQGTATFTQKPIPSHSGYCLVYLLFSTLTPNASIFSCPTCFLINKVFYIIIKINYFNVNLFIY